MTFLSKNWLKLNLNLLSKLNTAGTLYNLWDLFTVIYSKSPKCVHNWGPGSWILLVFRRHSSFWFYDKMLNQTIYDWYIQNHLIFYLALTKRAFCSMLNPRRSCKTNHVGLIGTSLCDVIAYYVSLTRVVNTSWTTFTFWNHTKFTVNFWTRQRPAINFSLLNYTKENNTQK